MAIEFNCPQCGATIRVPDAYAGKQGRCPKCDTRLLIPSVPLPNRTTVPGESPAVRPLQPTPGKLEAVSFPNVASLPGVVDSTAQASDDPFAVRPLTTSIARSHRRKARLRPSRALVIGVPVICFLVLFGIIAYSLMGSLPKLHGEFTGHRLDGKALPQSTISWGEVNLGVDDREILKSALTTQPESLISQFLTCRVSASDDGLVVTLATQPDSQWIAVDVTGDKPLAIWKRKEGPQWNKMRLDELRIAVNQYVKDKLLKISGAQIAIDPVATRDRVALNASFGPLGYVVQAIAESTVFPCVAEDELGKLYFCLPKTVQSFTIQGRTLPNGMTGFSGEYAVTISDATVTAAPIPAAEDTMSDEEAMSDKETTSDPSIPEGVPDGSETQPQVQTPNPEKKD
jgi:DNA-directed RNA polymerase subunit RPC12/RpoP